MTRMVSSNKTGLSKYLDGLMGYFLFMSMGCTRVGTLRMDDVDDSEVEAESVNLWIVF